VHLLVRLTVFEKNVYTSTMVDRHEQKLNYPEKNLMEMNL